jgi:hypothetical protein
VGVVTTEQHEFEKLVEKYGADNPAIALAELIIEVSTFQVLKRAGFMEELLTQTGVDWDAVEEVAEHFDEGPAHE